MLYGELIEETKQGITFRVISNLGDARTFGIWGEHKIARGVGTLKRRDARGAIASSPKTQRFDQLWLPVAELVRLGKACFPIDDDLPVVNA